MQRSTKTSSGKPRRNRSSNALVVRGSLPRMGNPGGTHLGASVSVGPTYTIDMPLAPLTAVWSAGAAAVVRAIDPTNAISNFSTRFASTFGEYRIIGARLVARVINSTAPAGVMKMYLDEKSSAAPTAVPASDAIGLELPLVQSPDGRPATIDWVAHDLVDLDWDSTTAPGTSPVWLKLFTNSANFGASGSGQVLVSGAARVQFRSLL